MAIFASGALPLRPFSLTLHTVALARRFTILITPMTTTTAKDEYISLLRSVNRTGVDSVVAYLNKAGFFSAPASVNRHLSHDGGLLEHSLNVCKVALRLREQMIALRPEIEERLPLESVVLAALLHDVCKANIYKKMTKYRKDANNRWEAYDGYYVDYTRFPLGHGEKSVVMLLRLGLELTNDEVLAIRWHMGAWDLSFQSFESKSNISAASDVPLVSILQAADALAAHLLEVKS